MTQPRRNEWVGGWLFCACSCNPGSIWKHQRHPATINPRIFTFTSFGVDFSGRNLKVLILPETGMADYAHKAATTGSIYLSTISEYDLYCHCVAGLVGEGFSRIFSASKRKSPG